MRFFLFQLLLVSMFSCSQEKYAPFKALEVYKSDRLIITQLAPHSFLHTSFKQTDDFGNVPCNGLVIRNGDEVIVFDTPSEDQGAEDLIGWVADSLHARINAIIPTHFHDDCLGGLKAFVDRNIPSYGNAKTIELARGNNYVMPVNSFPDSLVLALGNEEVCVNFFGEGHTKDNVVGYFAADHILFGGCLIKELDANKGYLVDANVEQWSSTVWRIKQRYPKVGIVVPGHGQPGDIRLLDYTINLFRQG